MQTFIKINNKYELLLHSKQDDELVKFIYMLKNSSLNSKALKRFCICKIVLGKYARIFQIMEILQFLPEGRWQFYFTIGNKFIYEYF